jgi:hypothetical protein
VNTILLVSVLWLDHSSKYVHRRACFSLLSETIARYNLVQSAVCAHMIFCLYDLCNSLPRNVVQYVFGAQQYAFDVMEWQVIYCCWSCSER